MQLNRKTSGEWKNARDFVGQDLDTIMRTANQQQQQLVALQALVTTIQAQLATPNIALAANGQVSGIANSRNLQTVAHDSTLTGFGTPTSPLSVVSSGGGTGTMATSTTIIPDATFKGVGSTIDVVMMAGVPGRIIHVIGYFAQANISVSPSFACSFSDIRYTGTTQVTVPGAITALSVGTGLRFTYNPVQTYNIQSAVNLIGAGLTMKGLGQNAANTFATTTPYTATLLYWLE